MKIVTFKAADELDAAILAAACKAKHGNKTQVITESLMANPAVFKQLPKKFKGVKPAPVAALVE